MDAILPIGLSLLGVFGGIAAYSWQKRLDRLNEISRERRELYRSFMKSVVGVLRDYWRGDLPAAIASHAELSKDLQVLQVAVPDAVANAAGDIDEILTVLLGKKFAYATGECPFGEGHWYADYTQAELLREFGPAEDRLLIEMRKDSFGESGLTMRKSSLKYQDDLVEEYR